ncbi:binding-protein-dependent transport systems inner membrane component [Thermobaculum terrenum ATCC BAA-798]|uniref:Binding-protein-dependent transport systems inner membrane component n=1 Tax=Thermobaculum terrenum (strain ATCC BAA-798 / CCMEE 7001 / YNP1) TaxID=525904 RepID=D1CGM5_THET1|nr:ABC transporter permease subunit [Thermobaculum terrenum]ACZ42896.1 binding-protein-dependent transport systems inner membrane component [Thermobaculum terrenum ATCC BAA-798]
MNVTTGGTDRLETLGVGVSAESGATTGKTTWQTFRRSWPLYTMLLPALLAVLIFSYGPMFGIVVAFQDYDPFLGFLRSPWVGFANFERIFSDPFFMAALRNSVTISFLKLLFGFPSAVILALLLNELHYRWFKRIIQTSSLLPYFVSWVVVAAIFAELLSPDGPVNGILHKLLGIKPLLFLTDPILFLWTMIFQDVWKGIGFGALLYLAAIAAIDPTLYEAAIVDGANRWQQMWYVTLPGIAQTMVVLFVLACGSLINAGFEQIIVQYSPSVYSTADILETLTYRLGLGQAEFGLAAAVGLFQAVVGFSLLLVSNLIVRKLSNRSLF